MQHGVVTGVGLDMCVHIIYAVSLSADALLLS